MNKKLLKAMALTAALSVGMSALCACGKKQRKVSENVSELSFSVYNPIFSKSPLGTLAQDKWQEYMEDYMGMKINIDWQEQAISDYMQKQQVYLASGDFADVFIIITDPVNNSMQLGKAGQLVDLNEYKDMMPYYSEYLNTRNERKRIETSDGEIYAFLNSSTGNNTGTQAVNSIRKDIFEKEGIKIPETLQEYYEAAKALKSKYPDSYPISFLGSPANFVNYFLGLNHTHPNIYYNGKEYVYGPVDDAERFKGTVEYLRKLYAEGLLDPEFLTQSSDQTMQKMINGKAFMVPGLMGGRINQYINNKGNGVEWGIIADPKNLYDEISWKSSSNVKGKSLNVIYMTAISTKAEHPDLIVKLLDYQYSDKMTELANWGVEGVTFTKDENGERDYTDDIKNAENPQLKLAEYGVNQSQSVKCGIQFMPNDTDSAIKLLSPVPAYKDGKWQNENFWKFTSEAYGDASINPNDDKPPVSMTADETEETSTLVTALWTYTQENVFSFITGAKSMSEWDSFMKEMNQIGDYKLIKDIYNKNS